MTDEHFFLQMHYTPCDLYLCNYFFISDNYFVHLYQLYVLVWVSFTMHLFLLRLFTNLVQEKKMELIRVVCAGRDFQPPAILLLYVLSLLNEMSCNCLALFKKKGEKWNVSSYVKVNCFSTSLVSPWTTKCRVILIYFVSHWLHNSSCWLRYNASYLYGKHKLK